MAADVKNDWVGYLTRSYFQIKTSLLGRVTTANPELTDHSESNIFIIFIDMMAALIEMLGYYIDNAAEEGFLATSQRRTSVIKHIKSLDYRIKARNPEQVDLTITWNAPVSTGFTISAGMNITSVTGIKFYSLADVLVSMGDTSTIVPIAQVTPINNSSFATTNGSINQRINLGTSYAHKTLQLTVNSIAFDEVNTFAFSDSTDKHYLVDIDIDGNAYAILGDGIKGVLPTISLPIGVLYYTTLAGDGRVGAGGFDKTTIIFNGSLPGGITVSNANTILASSGGTDYESTENIRSNAISSVRTLDRAVTRQDYIDIIDNVNGVGTSDVHFCCGKTIDIYIVPSGGGIASSGLISSAQVEINDKKMITTFPVVNAAGQTNLVIKATVTAQKRKSIVDTKTQVINALLEWGSVSNQKINGAVRLSDIQALIDNQPNVDFVKLTALYTKPYARPISPTVHNLSWTNETRQPSIVTVKWRLEYDGTNIMVFRDGVFQNNVSIGSTYVATDNIFTFTVNSATYSIGDIWEFNTYPFLDDIQLTDFTILGVNEDDLQITVNPASTNVTPAC